MFGDLFSGFGSLFDPSSTFGDLFGGANNGFYNALDMLDPGNTFHQGSSRRNAIAQQAFENKLAQDNYQLQKDWNDFNVKSQTEAYEYQKKLNEQMRQDSLHAVENRVADLRAAGLSPTLAAGSAAAVPTVHAGSAPQGVAPQRQSRSAIATEQAMFQEGLAKDRLGLAISALGNLTNVSRTRADIQLTKAKADNMTIMNKYLDEYLTGRNLGQTLHNDAQLLANRFAESANPYKLDKLKEDLNAVKQKINVDKAEEDLLRNKNLSETYNQFLMGLKGSELRKSIEEKDLKILSMSYTLEWAKKHGTPLTGYGHYQFLLDMADRLLSFLMNHGDRPTLPPLDPNAPPSLDLDKFKEFMKDYKAPPSLDLDKLREYQNDPDSIAIYRLLQALFGGLNPSPKEHSFIYNNMQ